MERDETIRIIRDALKARSGKVWSVTGGRGTASGWITITAPPKRRGQFGYMTDEDRTELGTLLGMDRPAHVQGVNIPASSAYRREYTARAQGLNEIPTASPYWD